MNPARILGPGDLSSSTDPRNPRPPLTEKEARSVYAKMKSGEVEEFLNQYLAAGNVLREPADIATFDAFVIRELIGEFEACPFSDLRARA